VRRRVARRLTTVIDTLGIDDTHLAELVERLRPRRQDPARYAATVTAGTVTDHVGRLRDLTEADAQEVMIHLPNSTNPEPLEAMAEVIAAFR
jgi:hypothetical protein